MIYISFVVPSYNSEDYLERCVDTLMPDSTDIEIIIVDDGSKDRTGDIADSYREKYPDTVRVVHKENGGHGSAVNKGLELARGQYLKVVDSDDWLDTESLKKLIAHLKEWESSKTRIDLIMCNYIYDHLYENKQKVMTYKNVFKENVIMGWDDIGHFSPSQYIIMHSAMFRTDVLRESGVVLPEHTFYVDNLFVYIPLPYVRRIYYLNTDFYRYYIGREDQSVNEKTMISRIDQQILVNRLMVDAYDLYEEVSNRHLRNYMFNYLTMICTVTSVMLILSKNDENLKKRDDLWTYFREKRPRMWKRVRFGFRGLGCKAHSAPGKAIVVVLYRLCQKIFKFN